MDTPGDAPPSTGRRNYSQIVIPDSFPSLEERTVDGKKRWFCPFGARCNLGHTGRKGFATHGPAIKHLKAHVAREAEAKAAARQQPLPDEALALRQTSHVRVPVECYSKFANVDIKEALAPIRGGRSTIQFIPKAARIPAVEVFNQFLSGARENSDHGRNSAVGLALFHSTALGVPREEGRLPEEAVCFDVVSTRRRVARVKSRTQKLLQGDFTGAVEEANDRDAAAAAAFRPTSRPVAPTTANGADPADAPKVTQAQKRRVHRFLKLGELSKALGALNQSTPAQYGEDTFARLQQLLPDAAEELDAFGQDQPAPVVCDANVMAKVIRKLRRGVAAGPSMLTNDHIKAMFPVGTDADKSRLEPLLDFVNATLAIRAHSSTHIDIGGGHPLTAPTGRTLRQASIGY